MICHPKDHWTLKTGYFEDPTPAIQVQTGPRSLGQQKKNRELVVSLLLPLFLGEVCGVKQKKHQEVA